MSPRVIESYVNVLRELIDEHHQLYIKFYGNLPFKFHNVIHYPNLLLKNGPFVNYWAMRFESNHRNIKSNADAVSGSKNLLLSIAKKQTLQMCQLFHSLKIGQRIVFGKCDKS